MSGDATTDRVRRIWDRQASSFDRRMGFWERSLFQGDREWACAQVIGDVLEVAVGTGRNLEHYPSEVRVVGIDLSPEMLQRARARAQTLGLEAALQQGDAHRLCFDDETFDTVLCTFSLCSIPEPRLAVREMTRVLRPGGRLVLVEHTASPNALVYVVQWLVHQVTYRLASERMLGRPRRAVAAAQLKISHLERRKAGIVERILATKPQRR